MYVIEDGKCWRIIDYVTTPFKVEVCPNCKDAGIYYLDDIDNKKKKYPFCHWCGYDFNGEYPEL